MHDVKPIEVNGDIILSWATTVVANISNKDSFDYHCNIDQPEVIEKCYKAHRKTLLHDFIESVVCENITYIMEKHFEIEAIEEMQTTMDSMGIAYTKVDMDFEAVDYSEVEKYADVMQEEFNDKALPQLTEAIFTILFNDKNALYLFNKNLQRMIKNLKKDDYPEQLKDDGYLNRTNPPTWMKRGVFNRDKGVCQDCGANLDRVWKNDKIENYDHIIPLRQGGTNDPTNFQLMCEHCNKAKRDRSETFRNSIWPYWGNEE